MLRLAIENKKTAGIPIYIIVTVIDTTNRVNKIRISVLEVRRAPPAGTKTHNTAIALDITINVYTVCTIIS